MKERSGKTFDKNLDKFVDKVDAVRQRAAALQQRIGGPSLPQADITPEALEGLQTAL